MPASASGELVAELGSAVAHALDQTLGAHRVEDGEADRARERRAVPRVAEGEAARALGERLVDVLADEHRADRRVAGAEPLRGRDDVRARTPSPRPRTSAPVRPTPVTTSSKHTRKPWRSRRSASPSQKRTGGV